MQPLQRSRVPIFLILRDGNFRSLWSAYTLIEIARRLELLVLSWFILQDTDSPLQLGLVLGALYIPRPIFSLFTGAIADRFSRHYILLAAQGLTMLIAAGILILIVSDLLKPWHVFLAVFLQGTAWSLEEPARRTAISDIVGLRRLVNAMSLDLISSTAGKLAGPLLGGVLLYLLGFTGSYGFVLVVHLMALGLLGRVKIPVSQSNEMGEPVWRSLGVAMLYTLHSPMLLGVLYVTFVMNALVFPVQQFIPAIGRDHLGVGPALVGLLVSAEGFGQLFAAGSIASMRIHRHHGRVYVAGALTGLVMAVLFVWSPWYALSFAFLTVSGIGMAGFATMQTSVTMLWSPSEMRGRMMGLLSICIGVGIPLGSLEIGAVASAFSTQWAISVSVLAALLVILPALTLTPLVWKPSGEPPTETARG